MGIQDELWKDVIESLFPQFLHFFAPDLAQDVNWDKGYEFLDKEFHQIVPESAESARYVDRLIKVFLKAGGERWVLVHVEVQGYWDKDFPRRMFTIFYRLLDKFAKDIVSLAVFSDARRSYKPDRFTWDFYGCSLEYRYRAYKVLEYADGELGESDNPFALVVLAAKKSVEIKDDEERRVRFKLRLMRELLKRGTSRDEVIGLLRFVDGIVRLSPEQERLVYEELHREEEKTMPYVTNWERFAMEKGMQQGMQQMVLEALEERFGRIMPRLSEQIRVKADQEGLQKLLRLALRAGDLEEFEAHADL
ncbi:MAG: hypothetical protein B1H02_00625 [Candidatus Latescibacteria bacterium 4484_107]|nr:MAG: hypothetical protein B1H02_00625 [Candidatus Latescibacteria bacterium 4484_107]